MFLWVDDLREPPSDLWVWAKSSAAAIAHLEEWLNDGMPSMGLDISLDHDLGGDDTTRPIILWLIENDTSQWIEEIHVHTANPVGREWLEGMIARYSMCDSSE